MRADSPTPKDLDEEYVRLTQAVAAEASAGLISRERAIAIGDALEREWRTNRWEAVQRGLSRQIAELEEADDPRYAGVIRMMSNFRDDPRTPMLREHCQCGGRLIKRQAVDAPEDDSPQVDWRCVDCSTLYDVTGASRGKDPRQAPSSI